MNTNTLRTSKRDRAFKINSPYYDNTIKSESVVDGVFYQSKPITIREMITRKINKSLVYCLMVTIFVTFVSYYIAMNYEAKLNKLDKEIVKLNNENQDLQTDLDRYKSFNNVDDRIGKLQLLQKAEKVIEVTAMNVDNVVANTTKSNSHSFNWKIGY